MFPKNIRFIFLFSLVTIWIFSGSPQIWHNPDFPPQIQKSSADTTSATSAGTGANQTGVGAVAWTDPGNITASDTSDASASLANEVVSNYLKATNFGFSIPASATIDGITVEISRGEGDLESKAAIRDGTVSIVKGGTIGSTNNGATTTNWPAAEAYASYGGATNLWGETWSASDINSSTFGVVLSAVNFKLSGGGGTETAFVDHIRITIDYTLTIPILGVTKVENDADNTVYANNVIRYTITINNTGTAATGITATDTIDTDFGTPYTVTFASCGASPGSSFSDPTLSFTGLEVTASGTCTIYYDVQVDSGVSAGATMTNSFDASAASEGGNNPAAATADTLGVPNIQQLHYRWRNDDGSQ